MSPPKPLGNEVSFRTRLPDYRSVKKAISRPLVRYAPALLVSTGSQTFHRCGLLDGDTLLRRRSDAQTRKLRGIRCRFPAQAARSTYWTEPLPGRWLVLRIPSNAHLKTYVWRRPRSIPRKLQFSLQLRWDKSFFYTLRYRFVE